jgi:hypothetical protein
VRGRATSSPSNYRSKTGTVDAFRYQSGLETMDFKYPFPDWLEGHVVVRGEFGLDLNTKFGKVTVRPGQWIVNAGNDNICIESGSFSRRI